MTRPTLMLPLVVALAAAPFALAQSVAQPTTVRLNDPGVIGTRVTLQLGGGDQLTGRLVSVANGVVTIRHIDLGEIGIATSRVVRTVRPVIVEGVELAPAHPETVPAPTPEPEPAPEVVEIVEDEPAVKWDRQFEVGLRGSSGNSDRLNFDAGLSLRREDDKGIFNFDTSYIYAQDDGTDTANRFDANLRNEWKLDNPRWTIFAQGSYILDEFQDWDYRVSGGAGVGYLLIDEEDTSLQLRAGVGASREFGDMADEDVVPELILGADLRHAFSDSNRLLASTEVFPSLSDFGEFRSISSAAWEMDIDSADGLSFRVGVEHRYESQVEDAEKSDFDYFARLVYSF